MSEGATAFQSPGPPAPPALARLGIERTCWEPGRAGLRWKVPDERWLVNTAGHLHGGYLCVMADSLLGSALAAALEAHQRVVNPDFHCHFLERVELGAVLEGEGRVVQRGRSVSFLEAEVRDAESGLTVLTAHSVGLVTSPEAPDAAAGTAPTDGGRAAPSPQHTAATAVEPTWTLPPWLDDFGARFESRGDGRCGLVWPVAAGRFDNRAGNVQGGYLALVADATMGFALIQGVPDAWAMATTTLSLQLIRPARAGMVLDVEAWVERRGRRFGFMACVVRAGHRVIARGRATGLLRLR